MGCSGSLDAPDQRTSWKRDARYNIYRRLRSMPSVHFFGHQKQSPILLNTSIYAMLLCGEKSISQMLWKQTVLGMTAWLLILAALYQCIIFIDGHFFLQMYHSSMPRTERSNITSLESGDWNIPWTSAVVVTSTFTIDDSNGRTWQLLSFLMTPGVIACLAAYSWG